MKRLALALTLVVFSSLSMALPSPKDITSAVNAGRLPEAERMLREVIAEKPKSAKAHYELGQVLAREGRKIEALQSLESARSLDPTLAFAADPQRFRDLVSRLTPPSVTTQASSPGYAAANANGVGRQRNATTTSFPWGYVLIGGGVVVLLVVLMRRRSQEAMIAAGGNTATYSPGAFSGAPQGIPQGGPTGAPAGFGRSGSGIGGAVLGGVAGLAAGYGLSRLLDGNSSSESAARSESRQDLTPIERPVQEDFGSFDEGAGTSWDSDAGSGDDSW